MKSFVSFSVREMIVLRQWSVWLICGSVGSGMAVAQVVENESASLKPQPAGVLRIVSVAQSLPLARIESIQASASELRRLLAMTSEERERALTKKDEKARSFLRSELEKYDAMSREDRETALQSLRVWYYLRELVKVPVEARAPVLSLIPETDREMVQTRLVRWDKLPGDLQSALMEHERFLRYALQPDGSDIKPQSAAGGVPESLKERWDERLEKWHSLPTERRTQIYSQFKRFFALSNKERDRVLETLSQEERAQAERTLKIVQALEKLSPAERDACVDAFLAFIETPVNSREHQLRLQEIHGWRKLEPHEQELFRTVSKFVLPPPPLPGSQPPLPGSPEATQPTVALPVPKLPGTASDAPVPNSAVAPKK